MTFVAGFVSAVDDIASTVLGPELTAALREGCNYVKNEIRKVAVYLQIVEEHPPSNGEKRSAITHFKVGVVLTELKCKN